MTDFADWQAPQAHATAINTTGVPLVRNITVLDTGPVIPANTSGAARVVAMPAFAEGYLIEVIPQNPGTRIFCADIVITHTDASNNALAVEQVTVSNWQNLGNDTSVIRGRLLGTSITVQALTCSSAFLNTITGGSVTADSVKVRTCALYTYVPGTGKRVPIITSADGLLLNSADQVTLSGTAGNQTLVSVLPDYTGAVYVGASTLTGGGTSYSPRINSYTVSNGTGLLSQQDFPAVNSTTPAVTPWSLPSCFNVAFVVQRATAASNVGFSVMIAAADQ